MLRYFRWALPIFIASLLIPTIVTTSARAENEGQEDLDQATDKKLSANTPDDFGNVIELCESALKKGLDKANTEFANNMLTSTLLQRATLYTRVIIERTPQGWPQIRKMALADLDKALKIQPDLAQAQIEIAQLQMLPGGDHSAAYKAAQKAVELSKDDPDLQVQGLIAEAKLVSDDDKIGDLLNQALKIAPKNDEVLLFRGKLYLEQGKFDDALADLDAAVKANPENAEAQEGRGEALFALQRNDDAVKAFEETMKLAPDSPAPYVHRARLRIQESKLDDALSDLKDALKIDSKNASALTLQAIVYHAQGKDDDAKKDIEELTKDDGDFTPELRILISPGSGSKRQVVADLQQVLKADPKNEKLMCELASLYALRKQPRKAIAEYSEALNVDPKTFLALRGRADEELSIGKHAEAIDDYNEALKIKTDDPDVLNNLAWVLATSPDDKLRDGKRAVELANKAADLTEHQKAHILSTLAAAYAETGDFDNAKKWSQKAVDLGSEDLDTNEQLKKELASYGEKKPWREKQEITEAEDAPRSADNSKQAKKE